MTSVPSLLKSVGWTQGITDTRLKMLDLQRQLGTGQIAETHGGLGSGRTLALSMQSQLARVDNFNQTIDTVTLRLDMMTLNINRFADVATESKSDVRNGKFEESSPGRTLSQDLVMGRLDEALSLLNAEVAGRHLFSGKNVESKPVESMDTILHGDGVRAGLDTLIAERKAADAGADGRGRLALANGGTNLTISEDADHSFGFKLAAISTDIAGATLTQPNGTAPQSADIALTGQPAVGDTVTLALDLPDGSREVITLSASADGSQPGSFAIGADATATIANIETALGSAIEASADSALSSASAITTSRGFFEADLDNPPQRIDGPPFESATGFVPGTAADTVVWYKGDADTDDARDTSVARIDEGIVVGYGARASEEPFSWALSHMAAFALETFDFSSSSDDARFTELRDRAAGGLSYTDAPRSIQSVQAEYVSLQALSGQARERHVATRQIAENALGDVTQINQEQVAVSLLQLQTQLQASYEATAMISRLNLAQFL